MIRLRDHTLRRRSERRLLRRMAFGALSIATSLAAGGCSTEDPIARPAAPATLQGTLTIAAYAQDAQEAGRTTAPTRQVTTFVPGAGYARMQDNDIRGFLEGSVVHGWNQAGQTHVRLGRPPWTRPFGEDEILRVLQRWDGIELPIDTRVDRASLQIQVERGNGAALEILLYEVKKDWHPGNGGTLRNNTSPPAPGEVWWQDAAFGEEPWSLPGASHASQTDPRADTSAMPLAVARYRPGDTHLGFTSEALTEYVTRRVRDRLPLLFLLKLADALEDESEGLALYSSEQGSSRNPVRRPSLELAWSSPVQVAGATQPVLLEHGRTVDLPRLEAPGAGLWSVGFVPAEGSERPTILVRGGAGDEVSPWRSAEVPFAAAWSWIEVRLQALRDPVFLGTRFRDELRDSWIRSAPPEEQEVRWRFVAPSGARHRVVAAYEGDFRWSVDFEPDELGRWHYFVEHDLTWEPYRSAEGAFDVVARDLDTVMGRLRELLAAIERSGLAKPADRQEAFGQELRRLQRAAMAHLEPSAFDAPDGRTARELIRRARAALSSRAVPERPTAMERPWEGR